MTLPEDWRSRACLMLVIVWGLAALGETYAAPMILEPTLMGPEYQADENDAPDGAAIIHNWKSGAYPWHRHPPFVAGKTTGVVTCVVWTHFGNATSFASPMPFGAPREAFVGKAPCETFLGPESGTGNKTWTAAVPALNIPGTTSTRGEIAYNLTCSDETVVSFGKTAVTNAPGTHLGRLAYASAGKDITITTEGTWELEVAWPKLVECFSAGWSSDNSTLESPIIIADQWGCVFAEFRNENGTCGVEYRTYYPDGCAVTNELGAVAFETTTSHMDEWTRFQPGDRFAPFGVMLYGWGFADETKGWDYRAYGPKLWPRALTEEERRQIVAKDAAVMLKRGILTETDLHPGEHVATLGLRSQEDHKHFPGNPPPSPPNIEDIESTVSSTSAGITGDLQK